MKKDLSIKEVERLRDLFWKLKEANIKFNDEVQRIADVHGCKKDDKPGWELTADFKSLVQG